MTYSELLHAVQGLYSRI